MITDIIFDWGGVLAPSTTRDIAKHISQKYKIDEEHAYKVIVGVESKYETEANHENYYKELSQKLGLTPEDAKKNLDNVSVGETFKMARHLSEKYRVHLLSNQVTPKAKAIRKANDLSFFKSVFFSNEIGLRKPDTKMFEFVLKMLDTSPSNILFVDDREENLKKAEKLGFKGILYENPKKLKEDLAKIGVNV